MIVGFIATALATLATSVGAQNGTAAPEKDDFVCTSDGLLLPVWMPQMGISIGDRFARGTVYFACLIYLFIGVSIVSDRFMGAIETITSKEKEVKVKRPNGEVQIVVVRV